MCLGQEQVYNFLNKYLDYNDFQWTTYLKTFDQPLWTFVGISAIVTGLSLWLIDSIFSKGYTTLQPTVTRIPSEICWVVWREERLRDQ